MLPDQYTFMIELSSIFPQAGFTTRIEHFYHYSLTAIYALLSMKSGSSISTCLNRGYR